MDSPNNITNERHSSLNDKRMAKALRILKDAQSVELKLTILDAERDVALVQLDLDVLHAELRQVIFFDTPDLRLHRAGLIVRARRTRKGGDAVIKLRPIVPPELPRRLRRSDHFRIEIDAMPGEYVCSGSLHESVDNDDVKAVIRGTRPIRKLFSAEQRTFFSEHAPRGLDLDALTPFGPINIAKTKFELGAGGRTMKAELWFYPDGSRILELSVKCPPEKAFQRAAEARADLTRLGITLTGEQQTKTRKALQYFADQPAHRAA
jgi:Uncharacterized conserved protein